MCLGSRVEETGGIVTTTVGRSKRVKMYFRIHLIPRDEISYNPYFRNLARSIRRDDSFVYARDIHAVRPGRGGPGRAQ
jgi:hypothetical protein